VVWEGWHREMSPYPDGRRRARREARSGLARGRHAARQHRLLLVLLQVIHVQVADRLQPILVRLHGECADQTQTAGGVGEDPHHMRATFDFLVQPLQHVGRFHVPMVRQRQPVERQRFLDVVFDPGAQLGVFALPFAEPGGEVASDLGQIAPVIEPPQLHQAVAVDLAGHVVQCVPEEVHVAALPRRLRQYLGDRLAKPRVVIGHGEFDTA
jgi:hypothetical protein